MRPNEHASALARVDRFLDGLSPKRMTPARFAGVLRDLHTGALHHPDPQVRRYCLVLLDHHANDASTHVFVSALDDEADAVREIALHSLACETCKQGALCLADVVPALVRVLESDPKLDLRIKALTVLVRLQGRETQIRDVLRRAAEVNTDPVTRRCAEDALRGAFVPPRKRYDRRQRKQAGLGSGTLPRGAQPARGQTQAAVAGTAPFARRRTV